MKSVQTLTVLAIAASFAGCSKPEPRSQQYFETHPEEARQVDAQCRDGSMHGDECVNADYAIQVAKARAQSAHFFKIGR